MTRALELYRSLPRYAAARAISGRLPSLSATAAGVAAPLRLSSRADPRLPGQGWVTVRPRLSGICGSDLATVTGRSSFYFSPLVSLPFTPGHEIVGDLDDSVRLADGRELAAGSRVVIDPVLGCATRGFTLCPACAEGRTSRCDRITLGHVSPGLQTGYCADTGGGWSKALVAHHSQVHPVPGDLSDDRAVLVEPLACAVHTARRARIAAGERVLIIGAGSVGLFTLLAVRALTAAGPVTVVAKHRRQVELARAFGATDVVTPAELLGGVRRATRALRVSPEVGPDYLLGGVDVSIDCAGSSSSLSSALRSTRAGGRVVVSGIPSGTPDLTPLWFRELELIGAYASGSGGITSTSSDLDAVGVAGAVSDGAGDTPSDDQVGDGGIADGGFDAAGAAGSGSDFAAAFALARSPALAGVVSATYPLTRYRDALDHALSAGRLGAIKVAFDLTAG